MERTGAWLCYGGGWRRLPDALFAIAEAIDQVGAAGEMTAGRVAAIASLREVLPTAQEDGSARALGLAGVLKIAVADSFSLDLKGDESNAKLVPILHRTGADADSPMLDPVLQSAFGEDQFNRFSYARAVYTLPNNTYVVLSTVASRIGSCSIGAIGANRDQANAAAFSTSFLA